MLLNWGGKGDHDPLPPKERIVGQYIPFHTHPRCKNWTNKPEKEKKKGGGLFTCHVKVGRILIPTSPIWFETFHEESFQRKIAQIVLYFLLPVTARAVWQGACLHLKMFPRTICGVVFCCFVTQFLAPVPSTPFSWHPISLALLVSLSFVRYQFPSPPPNHPFPASKQSSLPQACP